MATEYSIWCNSINKHINFNSEMIEDVEMFDLTTILSHFDQSNEDIVRWFTKHIDLLHVIDSIVTDEISDDPELLSISEGTIICMDNKWYVNINVLFEYIRDIDIAFAHEILAQAMFNRDDCSDCEYCDSDEPTEYDYSDESTASVKSGRSI